MNQPRQLEVQPTAFQGAAWARRLLARLGWTVVFPGLPGRQGIFVVYPHTSNWDFFVGILVKWGWGLPAHFWAKHSLFRIPVVGPWLRRVGGIAVDRRAPQGIVAATAQRFEQAKAHDEFFWLALTPEGTRAWRPKWRSGFYQLAMSAQVPVSLVSLDFGSKTLRMDTCVTLTGDPQVDEAFIRAHYAQVRGCRPKNAGPVTWL
jgi:1-acyl-sn-glycerol-3-phosphate acyltransferase